jgi:hypothetical protein
MSISLATSCSASVRWGSGCSEALNKERQRQFSIAHAKLDEPGTGQKSVDCPWTGVNRRPGPWRKNDGRLWLRVSWSCCCCCKGSGRERTVLVNPRVDSQPRVHGYSARELLMHVLEPFRTSNLRRSMGW